MGFAATFLPIIGASLIGTYLFKYWWEKRKRARLLQNYQLEVERLEKKRAESFNKEQLLALSNRLQQARSNLEETTSYFARNRIKWRSLFFLALLLLTGCQERSSSDKYTVAFDPTWFPTSFGNDTPYINGFTEELFFAIAKSEKIPAALYPMGWKPMVIALQEGQIDGSLTTLLPSQESEDTYDFSAPLLFTGPVLVVRKGEKYRSLHDMKGLTVGCSQFDDTVLLLQKYPVIIRLFENLNQGLEEVATNKMNGMLVPTLQAHALVNGIFKENLEIVTPPLNEKGLRLIVHKGEQERLLNGFNRGLQNLKKSSIYGRLKEKYHLE